MAGYSHLSNPDPEFAPLLALLPPDDPQATVTTIRERFSESVRLFKSRFEQDLPKETEYKVHVHQIDVGDGVKALAKCVAPVASGGEDDTFPVLFWLHGGGPSSTHRDLGFFLGNADVDDYRMRILSVQLRISIVNFEYRLAPENPFPAAVNDAFIALKYVASHAEEFSASLSKGFIVAGASSGGNLAAVLSHLARDDPFFKEIPLAGQALLFPLLVHKDAYPEKYRSSLLSLEQNKDAPILSKAGVEMILLRGTEIWIPMPGLYNAPPADTRMSPLLLSSHRDLPPAFIQVAGMDPLRDEGLLYEKLLKEAGVATKLEV
ncbi:hypothetical protein MPER_11648 [Moniliophthora perniciosa FA553]|nr:hypothetical protein MPER_11648 [Moniliophthora perniciosa FA553]